MKHDLKRVKALDGIRGLAAIMVFFSHFAVMFYPAFYWSDKDISHCNNIDFFIGQTPFSFLCNGNSGVMIFLMLTGFGSYMIRGGGNKIHFPAVLEIINHIHYFILSYLLIISNWSCSLSANREYIINPVAYRVESC